MISVRRLMLHLTRSVEASRMVAKHDTNRALHECFFELSPLYRIGAKSPLPPFGPRRLVNSGQYVSLVLPRRLLRRPPWPSLQGQQTWMNC